MVSSNFDHGVYFLEEFILTLIFVCQKTLFYNHFVYNVIKLNLVVANLFAITYSLGPECYYTFLVSLSCTICGETMNNHPAFFFNFLLCSDMICFIGAAFAAQSQEELVPNHNRIRSFSYWPKLLISIIKTHFVDRDLEGEAQLFQLLKFTFYCLHKSADCSLYRICFFKFDGFD